MEFRPKQAHREDCEIGQAEAALASQPSAEGDCDECGLAFDNIIHHTTAADDRVRNASHEFVAPSGPKETSVGDPKAKLESLRDELDSIARRHHASVKALAKQTSAKLTAIIEGKD